MNISSNYLLISILIMATITFLLRAAPFIIFPANTKTPNLVIKLSKGMPRAMIGLLVIYCFKDFSLSAESNPIPVILATLAVVIIHILKRNTLLSIGLGTVFYVVVLSL